MERVMMNNRILDLAEHCFEVYSSNIDVILFSHLLIHDCCKAIENWKKEPFPFDEDLAIELIHKNFGLELPPKNIKVIKI